MIRAWRYTKQQAGRAKQRGGGGVMVERDDIYRSLVCRPHKIVDHTFLIATE